MFHLRLRRSLCLTSLLCVDLLLRLRPGRPLRKVYRKEPNPAEQQEYCRSGAYDRLQSPRALPAELTTQGLIHSFDQRLGIPAKMKLADLYRLAARERFKRSR